MIKPLLIIDEKTRCFLTGKRGQARKLSALAFEFNVTPNNIGRANTRLYLIQKCFAEFHDL